MCQQARADAYFNAAVMTCACSLTLCIEREDSLYLDVGASEAIALKHGLKEALTVAARIQWGVRQKDVAVCGIHFELAAEGVFPDMIHVVPVLHDAIGDGVGDLQGRGSLC